MNTTPDPPLPSLGDIEKRLRDLGKTQRRAQLRALMPAIDTLSTQGVSYAAMAHQLTDAGLALAPESLRKALYRWRRRNVGTASIPGFTAQATALARAASPVPSVPPHNPVPPRPHSHSAPHISSKADLARLRDADTIPDLNALAELGRRK
ncbi:hypothetical protein [Bordetella bronchialis]|uniref:Uncharacterized protein n=1 Tax=Bordetella bronchialis TaxID=463025 RepID=A0A193G042_9BORD|nr:hypothetical protein [Bordetella bronchialis]ANN73235.1 hypothetical protein BAU08_19480 [Bordetella bronchialis]